MPRYVISHFRDFRPRQRRYNLCGLLPGGRYGFQPGHPRKKRLEIKRLDYLQEFI
ncbi:MAG: hypothetical protein K2K59_06560 [Muribaculaceae bacterium]|nr:hypothetical protein [Muribaculaceae bacterium]